MSCQYTPGLEEFYLFRINHASWVSITKKLLVVIPKNSQATSLPQLPQKSLKLRLSILLQPILETAVSIGECITVIGQERSIPAVPSPAALQHRCWSAAGEGTAGMERS